MMKQSLQHTLGATALSIVLVAGCSDHPVEHPDPFQPTSEAIGAIAHDALYVVNGGDNSVTVINTTTDSVVGTIRLRNVAWPHHLSLSPDRSHIALAVPGADLSAGHGGHGGHGASPKGVVMILDSRTGATIRARTLDAMNHNAIYSADGTEIWTVSMTEPGSVLVLDATTLATKQTIAVGDMPAEVTFDASGRFAFVANGESGTVSVIDLTSKQVLKTVAVGAGPVGAWPGRDGVMYVDNERGRSITAIDAAVHDVLRTYDLGFTPAYATVAPDGTLWVADADGGRVVIYQAESTTKIGAISVGAGAHAIVFGAGGATAYVSNQGAGTVSVIDVASQTVRTTVTVGAKPNGLAFVTR